MRINLYINGYDAMETWGVFLEDESLEKLLSGDTMKEYTKNQSRSIDGVHVSIKNPRLEERGVTVVFCFIESDVNFLTRYDTFLGMLKNGKVVDGKIYPTELKIPEIGKTYRLIYEGSTSLVQRKLKIGKVAVRFLEPNPANRTL